jgi:hypothetical protein
MYLCHFLTTVDSVKPFASGSRVPLFVDINTIFQKGDSILILIFHLMRDLGRHRGKHHCSLMSLTPITFDANTFSCCGGSYFATIAVFIISCRRPLNLVGPPMPTSPSLFISATITYGSEYVPLQNCLLPLSFLPRGCCSCLHQHFRHLLSELHHTSMGHACLVCTQLYIVTHLVEGRVLQVPFFSNGSLYTVPLLLSLTPPFSVNETLMDLAIRMLLTSSIRGHLLSLKFRLHMATRTPHRQNRTGVIHGTGLIPQHCKRVKNYTK